jgi:hypothetical protein
MIKIMMLTSFFFSKQDTAQLAQELIASLPDVDGPGRCWRYLVCFINAFVDNVATVLIVALLGLPSPGG